MLLDVKNLSVDFQTSEGTLSAVCAVSFHIDQCETLAVVGESGCGKSVLALSLCRLTAEPPATVSGDGVFLEGENLLTLPPEKLRHVRGKKIAYVFQDPQVSLNPVMTIGDQITEALFNHDPALTKVVARDLAIAGLRQVKIAEPEKRLSEYPHQLSGGMRQRVLLAMAIVLRPALLIADEPTTALDVSVQRQILDLIDERKRDGKMAVLFITHDLSLVSERADRIMVMYLGRVVETGKAADVLNRPNHPYTQALIKSIPSFLSADAKANGFFSLPGEIPNPMARPQGCAFQNRCAYSVDRCRQEEPPLVEVTPQRFARCFEVDRVISGQKNALTTAPT